MKVVYMFCTSCDYERRIQILSAEEVQKRKQRGEHVPPRPSHCPKCGGLLEVRS
jgi:hypothetical protein